MSVELTMSQRQYAWSLAYDQGRVGHWEVSADAWHLESHRPECRHAGDISLVLASFDADRSVLGLMEIGPWVAEFAASAIVDPDTGVLVPELEDRITPGPARMLVLCAFELTEAWRGFGLAVPLVSGALAHFARSARMAVCRLSVTELLRWYPDHASAEQARVGLARLLARMGFVEWRGVYVADLNDPALSEVRRAAVREWLPPGGGLEI